MSYQVTFEGRTIVMEDTPRDKIVQELRDNPSQARRKILIRSLKDGYSPRISKIALDKLLKSL